jgi:serine/threonine-protein kinase RsbW
LSELGVSQAICRRRAYVIDILAKAMAALRTQALELEAENARLRADSAQLRAAATAHGYAVDAALAEIALELDKRAPAAARAAVARHLDGRAPDDVLERARLVASELATNSVRHSGAPSDERLVLRIVYSPSSVRVEVEDRGCACVIAPRPPDPHGTTGGYGLHLVQTLSQRWGMEQTTGRATRVWADVGVAS